MRVAHHTAAFPCPVRARCMEHQAEWHQRSEPNGALMMSHDQQLHKKVLSLWSSSVSGGTAPCVTPVVVFPPLPVCPSPPLTLPPMPPAPALGQPPFLRRLMKKRLNQIHCPSGPTLQHPVEMEGTSSWWIPMSPLPHVDI